MILKRLKVQTTLGEATNCYIVEDEETKETMVIDPGGEADKIVEMLDILEANVKYIYLTHCHGDHIGAVSEVKNKKGGKILIHRDDAEGLDDENINLSACINMGDIELEPDSRVDDGDLIHVGSLEFRVIHTPGHTKGSTSLYCEKEGLLFSGDTLFRGTWGRTDLPTSSFVQITCITRRNNSISWAWKIYINKGRKANLPRTKTSTRMLKFSPNGDAPFWTKNERRRIWERQNQELYLVLWNYCQVSKFYLTI